MRNFRVVEDIMSPSLEMKETKIVLTKQQQDVVDSAISFLNRESEDETDNTITISGFAGTGKTTCIKQIIAGRESDTLVLAPTHKALNVIKMNFPNIPNISTLASAYGLRKNFLTHEWELNPKKETLAGVKVCLIDEASMMESKMQSAITEMNYELGIKTIFIGDSAQIPPVNSKEISGAFDTDLVGDMLELTKIMRQKDGNPNLALYTKIRENLLKDFNSFSSQVVTDSEGIQQGFYVTSNGNEKLNIINQLFSSQEFKEDTGFCKIITYTNRKIFTMNGIARKAVFGEEQAVNNLFLKGEILVGYDQISEGNLIQNSQEYIANSVNNGVTKVVAIKDYVNGENSYNGGMPSYGDPFVNKHFKLKGSELNIKETNIITNYGFDIFIPYICPENKEFFDFLFQMYGINKAKKESEKRRKLAYKTLCNVFANIQLSESLFVFEDDVVTQSVLKSNRPELFKMDDFGRAAIDKLLEDAKTLSLNKNIDYGYAISAHKSQGSTYSNVIVDIRDINNPNNNKVIYRMGKPYLLERSAIKYVALSRTKYMNYLFT